MSRNYEINPKHLLRINCPPDLISGIYTAENARPIANNSPLQHKSVCARWSPVNPRHYEDTSSDDEDDDIDHDQEDRGRFILPPTPSPSNLSGLPAQNLAIPQSDSSISSIEEQENPNMNIFDSYYNQDESSSPLEFNCITEGSVPDQDASFSQN